jgi:Zn-dependent protease with chaperone function
MSSIGVSIDPRGPALSNPHDELQPEGVYTASAFHPDFPGGRAVSGKLRIRPNRLIFEALPDGPAGGRSVEIPLRGAQVKLGGASNRLVFFTHPQQQGVSVYTSDQSILNDPQLQEDPELLAGLRQVKGKRNLGRLIGVSLLLLLGLSVVGLFLLKDAVVNFAASQVPPSMEQQLGQASFSQIQAQQSFVTDPEVKRMLRRITDRITTKLPPHPYQFEFHILDEPTVNAFALPGGIIVLNSGLIQKADTTEEVAGVVAHEIAHVMHQHGLKNLINSAGMIVVLQALIGDFSGLVGIAAAGGVQLARLGYSRQAEREADTSGFKYLVSAGVDPKGLVAFFKKVQQIQNQAGASGMPSMLSTHPATQERIEHLKAKLQTVSAAAKFRPYRLDFDAFQQAVAEHASGSVPASPGGNGSSAGGQAKPNAPGTTGPASADSDPTTTAQEESGP